MSATATASRRSRSRSGSRGRGANSGSGSSSSSGSDSDGGARKAERSKSKDKKKKKSKDKKKDKKKDRKRERSEGGADAADRKKHKKKHKSHKKKDKKKGDRKSKSKSKAGDESASSSSDSDAESDRKATAKTAVPAAPAADKKPGAGAAPASATAATTAAAAAAPPELTAEQKERLAKRKAKELAERDELFTLALSAILRQFGHTEQAFADVRFLIGQIDAGEVVDIDGLEDKIVLRGFQTIFESFGLERHRNDSDGVVGFQNRALSADNKLSPHIERCIAKLPPPKPAPAPPAAVAPAASATASASAAASLSSDAASAAKRAAAGPAMPSAEELAKYRAQAAALAAADDEDDDCGPKLLTRMTAEEREAHALIRHSREEELLAKQLAKDSKQPGRESWMTALPDAASLRLGGPEDLKARSFSQRGIRERGDTTAWTDSPAERKRKEMERELGAGGGAGTRPGDAAAAALGLGSERPAKRARLDPPIPVPGGAAPSGPKVKSLMDEHLERMARDAAAAGPAQHPSRAAGGNSVMGSGWNYERDMGTRRVNPKANKETIEKANSLMDNFTATAATNKFL